MSKFLKLVEANLPDSNFGADFDTLMDVKSIVNQRKDLGFVIIPIEGEAGTVLVELVDGRRVKLKIVSGIGGSEEAEDPLTKNVPTSSQLAADLVKNDTRVKRSLEPAIRKVSDALNRYSRG